LEGGGLSLQLGERSGNFVPLRLEALKPKNEKERK
jgi:hypothetical protein